MKQRAYILTAIVLATIILLVVFAPAIKRQLNDWKLLPQPERLTELYFTSPSTLPTTYVPGKAQTVGFTVHNLEYRTTTYHYVVTETSQAGTPSTTLLNGSFTLPQNQSKNVMLKITPTDFGPRVKFMINLQAQSETIDYFAHKETT